MKPITSSQTHEWWKDKTDRAQLSALLASYRSSQREHIAAGWRRNVMLGVLVIECLAVIRIFTTM